MLVVSCQERDRETATSICRSKTHIYIYVLNDIAITTNCTFSYITICMAIITFKTVICIRTMIQLTVS